MTKSNQDLQQTPVQPRSEGGRRRRFLGAGVSAAPLLLTLVSQPALGVNCFTPSRSLSKNTSLSQKGLYGVCTRAESPGNYSAQLTAKSNGKGSSYNWPDIAPPSKLFHSVFPVMGAVEGRSKFTNRDGSSKTLGEAIVINAPGQVHFHLIAAYLNKMGGNDASIPDQVMTVAGLQKIWGEFALTGYYSPIQGEFWNAEQIVLYLKSNGIVG